MRPVKNSEGDRGGFSQVHNLKPFSRRAAIFGFATLLSTIFLPVLAGCGGGGGGGKPSQNNSNTVTGIVRDSSRADIAVGGATVTIGGKSAVTTTVDQANEANPTGSFTIRDVPVGTTTATVGAPGITTQTIAFSPAVTAGVNAPIELIINIGQVSGRVLGPDGQPASGAFVTVLSTGESVVTGTDGTFLIINIPSGPTQVSAVLGTTVALRDVTIANGNTSVGDLQLAEDANLQNPPGLPATIVGTITLGNGLGVGSSTPVTLFRGGQQIEQTTSDANGNFGFYVPVGTYTIIVTRTSFETYNSGPLTVSNPSVALEANVTLNPQ